MAPSRRRGVSKAAAAAAARRQWKVGELVLAKVKGFPAWPATVSEPEKWGYSADWKKVLVYFFGTQQIAFCNPADVEAFTEEKKESLLIKRHGKGADYVRAVHEIIDSYEKLKKQTQVTNETSNDEDATKSVESLSDSGLKEEETMAKSYPKPSYSTRSKTDPSFPIEGNADAMQKDALCAGEMPSEEPTASLVVTETPLPPTHSARRKLERMQSQQFVKQKRAPSARRSRSSSKVDPRGFQNFILPSHNGGMSAGNVTGYVLRDKSVRTSKRIKKSPDVYEGHDTDSRVFVANGSMEGSGSEIVTVDGDTLSLNEGSTVESGCKLLLAESVVECCGGDVELSHGLDFQMKAVVFKKKRKPSRKRVSSDAAVLTGILGKEAGLENEVHKTELTDRPDKEADLEIEVHKTRHNSPCDFEKSSELYSKEDGDEHLPLVKRARVRMGRSSLAEKQDTTIQTDEKCSEVSNSFSEQACMSLDCEEGSPADKNPFVKQGADDASPTNKCPVSKPQFCQVKVNQQFGCFMDGEAALPPSKRLHRALEAMSANAAEDGQISSEAPSTMKTFINECCFPSRDQSNLSMESKSESEFGLQKDSFGNDSPQDGNSCFSISVNPQLAGESAKSFVEVTACSKPDLSTNSLKHELHKEVVMDSTEGNDLGVSYIGAHTADIVVVARSLEPGSTNFGEKEVCPESNQASVAPTLPSNKDLKTENSDLSKPCEQLDPSEICMASPVGSGSPQNETSLLLQSGEGNCSETTKLWEHPLDEKNQDEEMCDVLKETKPTSKDSNATPSPTTENDMMPAVHGPHQSHSISFSEYHLDEKAVSGSRSPSSPTDGLASTTHASPPNISVCNMSTSDNRNSIENNGCCSPDVHMHNEKPKHSGKWINGSEAYAVLTSFEAILGTLTRTKESIGRATRMAIDCAKCGIGSKVVEILARSLEKESRLHRKVDFFFLVDSITQWSRGLKGHIGGIYPSAIQAVLPRLLLAAAPPGSSGQENRRQCLKVLRVWQERRILPESVIRHHIRELESLNCSSSTGAFCRRPLRTERPFDDPIRQMEGMLVDEYGSNSSFQLPGFCMPPMLKDEDEVSDSDGESFEAVTPEHYPEKPEDQEGISIPAIEKHRHILEDVDGELEMEDVAPPCEAEVSSTNNVAGLNAARVHHQFELRFPLSLAPPLPEDVPPSSPPLPTSPPPPPPPTLPPPAMPDHLANSKVYTAIHNIDHNSEKYMAQQSVATGINPAISDVVLYHAPENRDIRMHIPDSSSNSGSVGSLLPPHQPIRAVNSGQQTDGAFHNKTFHLRPPHPAPSNQFSYVQADQQGQPRDIPLPSYPNRSYFVQNTDNGNFYSDHDRMKMTPCDTAESWRFPAHSFSGPCYPDNTRASYPPVPYTGQHCEPVIPNHRWPFPPRDMNHGEAIRYRLPSEGPIPVGIRAPNFWRPR